jgi:RHS repeat-associated protein
MTPVLCSPPSRPSRPRRTCREGSESRPAFHPARRHPRRGSDCRKSLLTPGSDRARRQDHVRPLFYAQYTSTDTGLIYMRARVYDPSTAQFPTTDPVVGLTLTPYGYTYDNPLNAADPTGLCSIDPFSSNGCLSEGVQAVGEGLKEAGGFVVNNPVIISAAGCTVGALAGPEVCAAALALSYGISTRNNIAAYRDGHLSPGELVEKQLLTAALAGTGALPGLPLLSSSAASLLGESPAAIQLLVNAYLEGPDIAFSLLEKNIFCMTRA